MAKAALVDRDIELGEQLVRALDEANVPVRAAFWLYSAEAEDWKLVVASPFVDTGGPRKTYKRIQDSLKRIGGEGVRLDDISVVGAKDPLVQVLGSALQTGRGIAGIRFSRNTIGGVHIEDAYIYRVS